jgi:uncharacterized protein YbjT (DUF2867 family)
MIVGSLEDLTSLRIALLDVQRAYYCPPLTSGALRLAALFVAAAHAAKLEAVVVLSQWLSDPAHPAVHSREKWLSSKLFETSGMNVITVNPGFFADNYFTAIEPMAHFGIMALPLGQGLNAPPSNEDIGRVIVGALADPARHIGKSYRPTGPRLMSPDEIAAAIGAALGRNVKYQNAPMRLFLKGARSLGFSNFLIEELSCFGIGAPIDAVLEVGHTQPERFELIDFLPAETRRIGRKGFQINPIRVLNPLLPRLFPPTTRVLVRYVPRNPAQCGIWPSRMRTYVDPYTLAEPALWQCSRL